MATPSEFLETIAKHLTVNEDGSISISDPTAAKQYHEYLQQYAKKTDPANLEKPEGLNIYKCNDRCAPA